MRDSACRKVKKKAPHRRKENCPPRVPSPREARSTGEMRGLTVVAGCNNYMDNRLEEVKRLTARQEVRAASAFGPLLGDLTRSPSLRRKGFLPFRKTEHK